MIHFKVELSILCWCIQYFVFLFNTFYSNREEKSLCIIYISNSRCSLYILRSKMILFGFFGIENIVNMHNLRKQKTYSKIRVKKCSIKFESTECCIKRHISKPLNTLEDSLNRHRDKAHRWAAAPGEDLSGARGTKTGTSTPNFTARLSANNSAKLGGSPRPAVIVSPRDRLVQARSPDPRSDRWQCRIVQTRQEFTARLLLKASP